MWAANGFAACCDLVKLEGDPATTHVRVCDPSVSAECASWMFEGDVAHGAPQQICVAGSSLTYQEHDAASNAWSPATEARCDAETDVEL
jgi:hypothetical protein